MNRPTIHRPLVLPRHRRIRTDPGRLTVDIPGPWTLEWSVDTAKERLGRVKEDPIPVATGLAFAAAPYVVGAAIVRWGPAPMKPFGVAMLAPNPVADAFYFSLGYSVGEEIEEYIW